MSANPRALRRSERLRMVLPARCRSRSGFVDRGTISNLSEGGCRFESFALTLHEGDLVVIRPEGLEGLCGRVRWTSHHSAGIEFAARLYVPVLDHLHRQHGHFLAHERAALDEGLRIAA
jgi:hypothetical protein